jgi:enoyl-CoA hydratase/carnithine racemase
MSSNASILPPQGAEVPGKVDVSISDGVGWIVLDNPSKLNAVSETMWRTMVDTFAAFETDAALRCVVLTGQGRKAFCAGADLAEKNRAARESGPQQNHVGIDALGKIQRFSKPTVAMISGHCLGAGLALALACDMRVAAVGSRFGVPAAKLGLPCNYALVERLAHLIGPSTAKRMIFTADRFTAEDALRTGLIDQLVAEDDLRSIVRDMAARIAANAPLTIAAAKYAVETVFSDSSVYDKAGCAERERACIESDDYAEGRRAFIEKRAPSFQGR